MTNEEAMEIITNALQSDESKYTEKIDKALALAQKALESKADTWSIKEVADALEKHGLIREQEPCEDCVSRDWLKIAIHNFYQGLKHIPTEEDIQVYIDVAPSVTPQSKWIACSERLPENDEVVLGTNSSNDLFKTYTWDDCGEIKWYADGCFDVPVIAWMPLPEPYKEDEEK